MGGDTLAKRLGSKNRFGPAGPSPINIQENPYYRTPTAAEVLRRQKAERNG